MDQKKREKLKQVMIDHGYPFRETSLEYSCPRCGKTGLVFISTDEPSAEFCVMFVWEDYNVDVNVSLADLLSSPAPDGLGCGYCSR